MIHRPAPPVTRAKANASLSRFGTKAGQAAGQRDRPEPLNRVLAVTDKG
jgi:hypothetical protein